jgi:cysteinyl-tRNA synthetase
MDEVLGLNLFSTPQIHVPDDVMALAQTRMQLRDNKQFDEADAIRNQIIAAGFDVKDTDSGFELRPL